MATAEILLRFKTDADEKIGAVDKKLNELEQSLKNVEKIEPLKPTAISAEQAWKNLDKLGKEMRKLRNDLNQFVALPIAGFFTAITLASIETTEQGAALKKQFDDLRAGFQEFSASFARYLLPYLQRGLGLLERLLRVFEQMPEWVKELSVNLGLAALGLVTLFNIATNVVLVSTQLGNTWAQFALVMKGSVIPAITPFLPLIAAIAAAAGALYLAYRTNFLGIRDIVDNAIGWFTDLLREVVYIVRVMVANWELFANFFRAMWDGIVLIITGVNEQIIGRFEYATNQIQLLFARAYSNVLSETREFLHGIVLGLSSLRNLPGMQIFNLIPDDIHQQIDNATRAAGDSVQNLEVRLSAALRAVNQGQAEVVAGVRQIGDAVTTLRAGYTVAKDAMIAADARKKEAIDEVIDSTIELDTLLNQTGTTGVTQFDNITSAIEQAEVAMRRFGSTLFTGPLAEMLNDIEAGYEQRIDDLKILNILTRLQSEVLGLVFEEDRFFILLDVFLSGLDSTINNLFIRYFTAPSDELRRVAAAELVILDSYRKEIIKMMDELERRRVRLDFVPDVQVGRLVDIPIPQVKAEIIDPIRDARRAIAQENARLLEQFRAGRIEMDDYRNSLANFIGNQVDELLMLDSIHAGSEIITELMKKITMLRTMGSEGDVAAFVPAVEQQIKRLGVDIETELATITRLVEGEVNSALQRLQNLSDAYGTVVTPDQQIQVFQQAITSLIDQGIEPGTHAVQQYVQAIAALNDIKAEAARIAADTELAQQMEQERLRELEQLHQENQRTLEQLNLSYETFLNLATSHGLTRTQQELRNLNDIWALLTQQQRDALQGYREYLIETVRQEKLAEIQEQQTEQLNEQLTVYQQLKNSIGELGDAIGGLFSGKISQLVSGVSDFAKQTVDLLSSLTSGNILSVISSAIQLLSTFVNRILPLFRREIGELQRTITETAESGILSGIRSGLMAFGRGELSLSQMKESIKQNVFSAVVDGIIQAVVNARVIQERFSALFSEIANKISRGDILGARDTVRYLAQQTARLAEETASVLEPLLRQLLQDAEQVNNQTNQTISQFNEFGAFITTAISIPFFDATVRFDRATDRFGSYINQLTTQGIVVTLNQGIDSRKFMIPATL